MERRGEYRIRGRAQVLIKPVEKPRDTNDCARGYFMSTELMEFASAYEGLRNRTSEAMARLSNSDSGLSDVLSLMDQKLDLIEQRFHLHSSDEEVNIVEISLSGSGVRVDYHQGYKPGCILAVRLTLLPGHSLIYTLAKCIRCEARGPGVYDIALTFIDLNTQESQILHRHIMQIEREFLRGDAKVLPLSG